MAGNHVTANDDCQQSFISLQNAVAYMISNPRTISTNQPLGAGSHPQTMGSNDCQAQNRFIGEGQPYQLGEDTVIQESPRRNYTHSQQQNENINFQRQRPSAEGYERIGNELAENNITLITDNDLQNDLMENPSNRDDLTLLPIHNNIMLDSYRLPAGSRIRNPRYQTFNNRLKTFINWPSHLTQTPRELAQAGFYSLEKDDIVRCFACDGGLKNWEPEDDPWIEHARWFSACDYLRHVKGDEFIRLVRIMDEDTDTEDELKSSNDEEETTKFLQALNLDGGHGKAEPSVLDADCAQSVIQNGFSDIAVVRAINDLLKEGREEYGSQDILTVILDKEEEGDMQRPERGLLSSTSRYIHSHRNEAGSAMPVLQENYKLKRQVMCTECGEHERNVLFLPCKHHTVCEKCSVHIYVCFTCFRRVRQKVKTYMS
ncbi:hypothetical protein ACJMK2_028081 [Sinanodonta woodiana]|uniref:RING-type domain-containing protein n=1 Tax=Sinanodonta woodiana TaxID=1069815 RepID=A0ABD3X7K3_SINWO